MTGGKQRHFKESGNGETLGATALEWVGEAVELESRGRSQGSLVGFRVTLQTSQLEHTE